MSTQFLKAFANMSESQKKQVLEDWLTGMGESLPKAEQLLNTKYERTGMYDWDELCSKVIAFPLERLPMYEEYCELFKLLIPRIIRDWERFVDLNVSHPEKEVFVEYSGFFSHNTVFRNMYDNLSPQHKLCFVCNLLSNFILRKQLSVQFHEIEGDVIEGTRLTETQDKMCTIFTLVYLKKILMHQVDNEIIFSGSYEMRKRLDPTFDSYRAAFSPKEHEKTTANASQSLAKKKISSKKVEMIQEEIAKRSKTYENNSKDKIAMELFKHNLVIVQKGWEMINAEYEDIPEQLESTLMKGTKERRYVFREKIVEIYKENFTRMQSIKLAFEFGTTLHKNENFQDWLNMIQFIFVDSLFAQIPNLIAEMCQDVPINSRIPCFPAQAQWIKEQQAYFEKICSMTFPKPVKFGFSPDTSEEEKRDTLEKLEIARTDRGLVDVSVQQVIYALFNTKGAILFKPNYPILSHPAKCRLKFDFKCANCGKKANHYCGGCKIERYCSVECMKSNWKVHKPFCQEIVKTEEKRLECARKAKQSDKVYNIFLYQ